MSARKLKHQSFLKTTANAWSGFKVLCKENAAKRELLLITASAILFGVAPSNMTGMLLIVAVLLLAFEAINTSIEILCDHVTADIHPAIKNIKDCAAAAIMITTFLYVGILSVIAWNALQAALAYAHKIDPNFLFKIRTKLPRIMFAAGAAFLYIPFYMKRKWLKGTLFLAAGFVWVLYFNSFLTWISSLGADSFAETSGFLWKEALFFLKTLRYIFEADFSRQTPIIFVASLLPCAAFLLLYRYLEPSAKLRKRVNAALALVLMTLSVILTVANAVGSFIENTQTTQNAIDNFKNEPPSATFKNKDLKFVVYIGEATSTLNMGLYGYPRDTTPHLSKLASTDNNFIYFQNVFAPHTHTRESLLESLSLGRGEKEQLVPIYERQRVSVVDILTKNNLPVLLCSNQEASGTYELASSIIFKNSDNRFAEPQEENDVTLKPLDTAFFQECLPSSLRKIADGKSGLIFLHSYAGHGAYTDYIAQEFRSPVDNLITRNNTEDITGHRAQTTDDIEGYDSAVRYIDHSIHETLQMVKARQDPTIFIYFSDHGESVLTNRGHDSARFIHEMAAVPFILYFNEAAKKRYPDLFTKYSELAQKKHISTLAQLPATLLDLLGGKLSDDQYKLAPTIGQPAPNPYIVVRNTSDGQYSFVRLGPSKADDKMEASDKTDAATETFIAKRNKSNEKIRVCYGDVDTIGKAIRGALVADCLHLKTKPDQLIATNKTGQDTISEIITIATRKNLGLWIDADFISTEQDCERLNERLVSSGTKPELTLVSVKDFSCANKLKSKGYRTAYALDTANVEECLKTPNGSKCHSLRSAIMGIDKEQRHTDIIIRAGSEPIIDILKDVPALHWSIEGVDPKKVPFLSPHIDGFVATMNDDPNGKD